MMLIALLAATAAPSADAAPPAPASEVVATDWSLGRPKARRANPAGKRAAGVGPAQAGSTRAAKPRITARARPRNGRTETSVGVKLPF